MDIRFAHVCDYASVSREGKLSVMGIFERIGAVQVPVVHPQLYLAFELELNYAEVGRPFSIEIQVVDADGKTVAGIKGNATLQSAGVAPKPGENPRLAQIIALNNLKFDRFGAYNINIFLHEQLKKQLEFSVQQMAQPREEGTP